ncbi:MAG: NAD(P)/FAD-dependent oxidoreductase [Desulfovibrionaceae bacterium]|jgi:thioredoxin reductase (NADPH)|nr:NAD(P)/FAD-dependent oxidoreductase [Desulfovibrionaceae bacterium]
MEQTELLIIGQGPAGLSAAIYAARAGVRTTILGCAPKVAGDYDIDNYFGFEETISGHELIERGKRQATRFGASMRCERVLGLHQDEDGSFVATAEHGEVRAQAVILATGVSRARPGVSNLADYEGKGVSYCVSCDGFFYRNRPVLVAGQGTFAANQALELTNYTPRVTIVTQGKAPTMSADYRARLAEANIPVLERSVVRLEGATAMERAVLDDGTGLDADGLFVAMGEASSLDFAYTLGLERNGVFIQADSEQRTNIPGVYAAGDCVGRFLQIAVAVGEGAKAGRAAIEHVKARRKAA